MVIIIFYAHTPIQIVKPKMVKINRNDINKRMKEINRIDVSKYPFSLLDEIEVDPVKDMRCDKFLKQTNVAPADLFHLSKEEQKKVYVTCNGNYISWKTESSLFEKIINLITNFIVKPT